jgi:sorbitol-specific phosphotransferase system component IIBC
LIRSLVWGLVVQAVLTEPIVTDYVPVARPPWALLLFAVCLLALVVPRGVVWEFLLGAALAVVIGVVVNWVCAWRACRNTNRPA